LSEAESQRTITRVTVAWSWSV